MSITVTSATGYGLKIDKEAFTKATGLPTHYADYYFDEDNKPSSLFIQEVGFAGNEEHWIFIKAGYTKVYSGYSGNGNSATLLSPSIDPTDFFDQHEELLAWMKDKGQTGTPTWSLVQYIN
jgi:hypothetical protein